MNRSFFVTVGSMHVCHWYMAPIINSRGEGTPHIVSLDGITTHTAALPSKARANAKLGEHRESNFVSVVASKSDLESSGMSDSTITGGMRTYVLNEAGVLYSFKRKTKKAKKEDNSNDSPRKVKI